ncbi:LamG domain-containing protein [Cystobacter fuscus]|nr:LamG domain-containing protein [Cystobacter fuscus]
MLPGITFHAVTGKLMGSIRGSSNVATYVTGTKTINDGQYHHVAYVRDTSAQLLRLFVDGEADGTVAITANNIANTDVEMDPIQIRAKHTPLSTGSNSFFAGIIDDVRWYQAALTGSVK